MYIDSIDNINKTCVSSTFLSKMDQDHRFCRQRMLSVDIITPLKNKFLSFSLGGGPKMRISAVPMAFFDIFF